MAEPKHTVFAAKAIGLAELFQGTFGTKPVGKAQKYRVELAAPEGPSTGGGTQAVQPIKLVPIDQGVTLVAGSANKVDSIAELRTYEYLQRVHAQRFKGAGDLLLEREEYDALLQRMKTFLEGQKLRVTVVAAPPGADQLAPVAPALPRSQLPMIIAGAAIGLVILFALIAFLRH